MTETAKDNLLVIGLALILSVCVLGAVALASSLVGDTRRPELPQSQRVGETPSTYINRWHDDEEKVTCWQVRGSISCLRDVK